MKKLMLLAFVAVIMTGCHKLPPLPPSAQLDIVNGTEYIVTRKNKNPDEYTYCYRLIKFGQDKSFDYAYRDTSNYNVGDTIILTVKKK